MSEQKKKFGLRLFGPKRLDDNLQPGTVFRNVRPDSLIETAKVLAVTKDGSGIPHVRYDVTVENATQSFFQQGTRLLCLSAFVAHFTERVSA